MNPKKKSEVNLCVCEKQNVFVSSFFLRTAKKLLPKKDMAYPPMAVASIYEEPELQTIRVPQQQRILGVHFAGVFDGCGVRWHVGLHELQ